ncbi:hypothetical protein TWF103_004299 [Orbilia oligospora]|nr:hypothetical protein TWF103_004299 [Orbilia oligospora]
MKKMNKRVKQNYEVEQVGDEWDEGEGEGYDEDEESRNDGDDGDDRDDGRGWWLVVGGWWLVSLEEDDGKRKRRSRNGRRLNRLSQSLDQGKRRGGLTCVDRHSVAACSLLLPWIEDSAVCLSAIVPTLCIRTKAMIEPDIEQ